MNIDWKALKKQKEEELPAAEIAHEGYIQKLVATYEKRLYLACKDQTAGEVGEYDPRYLDDSNSVWWKFFDAIGILGFEVIPYDPHVEAMKKVVTKLQKEGVDCRLSNDSTEIIITLP